MIQEGSLVLFLWALNIIEVEIERGGSVAFKEKFTRKLSLQIRGTRLHIRLLIADLCSSCMHRSNKTKQGIYLKNLP